MRASTTAFGGLTLLFSFSSMGYISFVLYNFAAAAAAVVNKYSYSGRIYDSLTIKKNNFVLSPRVELELNFILKEETFVLAFQIFN